ARFARSPRSEGDAETPIELELALVGELVILELDQIAKLARQAEADAAEPFQAALDHGIRGVVQPEGRRIHFAREEVDAEPDADVRLPTLAPEVVAQHSRH